MTKAKGSAKKGMSLQELKIALLEDEQFLDAIAAAMPMPAARENPAPEQVDMVEMIYRANPGLREIQIIGSCSGCSHPIAAGDTACISCGEVLEN